jgi:hypothetical protein
MSGLECVQAKTGSFCRLARKELATDDASRRKSRELLD